MKKYSITLVLSFIIATIAMSQEYWYWQSPTPQGNELNDLWIFNDQVIVAVGDVGTVIKTTDGGLNWSVTHYSGGITSDLYTVFFTDQNTGWTAGAMGKILKTTDGGKSWSVKTIMDSLSINSMFFLDSQHGWAVGTKIYLGDQQGVILKTTDGGTNWTIMDEENTGAKNLNDICFVNDNLGWIIGGRYENTEDIILRTIDGGKNWYPSYSGKTAELYSVYFVDSLHGWAVGKGTSSSSMIIHTDDGGINWNIQTNPRPNKVFFAITFRDQNQGWIACESGYILKTVNGGVDWTSDGVGTQAERNLKAIGFTGSNFLMAIGNAGLIIKSNDNGSVWQEVSNRITTRHFYAVDFVDPNNGWIVGDKTIVRSADGGESWTAQASTVQLNLLDIAMINSTTGWTVGEQGVILKTTNGGNDWNYQTSGTFDFLHSCFFLNDQEGWICGGPVSGDTSIILHTTNGGEEWSRQNCTANASLRAIYFTDALNGWAVGENSNVVHTTNGGVNWSLVDLGRSEDFYSVYFLTNNIGWIGGNSIIFTVDGGATWNEQKAFSEIDQVRAIKFMDLLTGWAVLQGSTGALYKTIDGGVNWYKIPIGTANKLYDIDIVNGQFGWLVGTYATLLKNDAVFVPVELTSFNATWIENRVELSWITASELNNYGFEIQQKFGDKDSWEKIGFIEGHGTTTQMNYYSFNDSPKSGGKHSYRLKQIDLNGKFKYSSTREVNVPTKFALYQNKPNPFNPETTIGFELSINTQVTLEIYNMLGQKIVTLINERRPAGFQQIIWNGKDDFGHSVGSGVYFYRIKAGNFEATRKLVLLR